MKPAYIVATARTPMARSYKGAFAKVTAPSLFGASIREAIQRAGLDRGKIDDVIMGCALPEGTQYYNIGRMSALAAGLPDSVPGMTVDRQCSSGLMAVAIAAMQIQSGQSQVVVAGGGEQLSLVQNQHMNTHRHRDNWLLEQAADVYMSMLETAEVVASRYGISRARQDEYALMSQQRTASAAARAIHARELFPVTAEWLARFADDGDAARGALDADETPRPRSTLEGLSALGTAIDRPDATITAGNACCFADASAALVLADKATVDEQALRPLAIFHGVAVAGCAPDEMGIGPVVAVPKLLKRFGLGIKDIDIWELNEAFASQVLYCADTLGLDLGKLSPNGGAIALGHPYGMTGARMIGSAIYGGQARGAKYAVVTMCVGGGQGAAGLIEVLDS